jgi:asparagine synthetase B (glutamine-hydrolysing)
MAKNIWIYSRKKLSPSVNDKISKICDKISPDNIEVALPKVVVNDNFAYGIMNPTNTLLIKDNSLLMGQIMGDDSNWDVPKEKFPDGSFSLFRDGKDYCELVTDAVASRTIWYYKNDELFIASSSQRAIILFIGGFEFNENVIPWMTASGCLGPGYSWDKRISMVPPDSSVLLDKNDWSLIINSNRIEFNEAKFSDQEHKKNLTTLLNSTFKTIKYNFKDWVLPLSGGYDSRAILCFLEANDNTDENLRTVTWGLESSLSDEGNDAYVATELAKTLGVKHKYYNTNLSDEPAETLLNRFLQNGEGRIDHVSGYMDGFEIWKSFYEDGVQGVIRGDESFGWLRRPSELGVQLLLGLGLCDHYSNLSPYAKKGLFKHELPEHLKQREGESLHVWRDRLYQQHRAPTALSALSELKLGYVELSNPFLSKGVLTEARKLPDHLRTEKELFKEIVRDVSPKVPFSKRDATASPAGILKQKRIVDILSKEIASNTAKELFPEEFLKDVLEKINVAESHSEDKGKPFSIKGFIGSLMPRSLKSFIRSSAPSLTLPPVDNNVLAFRVYMTVRMNQILKEEL